MGVSYRGREGSTHFWEHMQMDKAQASEENIFTTYTYRMSLLETNAGYIVDKTQSEVWQQWTCNSK